MSRELPHLTPEKCFPEVNVYQTRLCLIENQGLWGEIRVASTDAFCGNLTYQTRIWRWSKELADSYADGYEATFLGIRHNRDNERGYYYNGWQQLGETQCFGSQGAAETHLLELIEFPSFTLLKLR